MPSNTVKDIASESFIRIWRPTNRFNATSCQYHTEMTYNLSAPDINNASRMSWQYYWQWTCAPILLATKNRFKTRTSNYI